MLAIACHSAAYPVRMCCRSDRTVMGLYVWSEAIKLEIPAMVFDANSSLTPQVERHISLHVGRLRFQIKQLQKDVFSQKKHNEQQVCLICTVKVSASRCEAPFSWDVHKIVRWSCKCEPVVSRWPLCFNV